MRILYITPFFQHPNIPGPTRHYHFIRELSKRHKITLLTPVKSYIPAKAMEEMNSYTERILTFDTIQNGVSPQADEWGRIQKGLLQKAGKRLRQMRRNGQAIKEMKKAFLQLVEREAYDVVLFHGKSVFSVIEDCDRLPVVVDVCDATSLRIAGMMPFASVPRLPWLMWKYHRIRQIERKIIKKTPYLAFISNRDREAVLGRNSRARIVPNIVDVKYWKRRTNHREPNCIIFSGAMDYHPNHDGALYLINQILPLARQSIPDLQVLIAGRDPRPELLEAARPYPDITITGSVDDMRPYFERATLCAASLRIASGQQNKLLEAMAMEVPVVTTPVAAAGVQMDGIEAPLVVAEGEKAFAEEILRLLTHEEERTRLAVAGRCFVEEHFGWAHSAEILEEMCIKAIKQD